MGRGLWASVPEGVGFDTGTTVLIGKSPTHIDQDGLYANEDQLEIECSSLDYIDWITSPCITIVAWDSPTNSKNFSNDFQEGAASI